MRPSLRSTLVCLPLLVGCGRAPGMVTNVTPVAVQPLDPALALVVEAPTEPLLGAVYDGPTPSGAHSLADLNVRLRDNPCQEHLEEVREPAALRVADVWSPYDALFAQLHFAPFAPVTTHLFVHVEADTVHAVREGEGYAQCCQEAAGGCGDGLISALYEGQLDVHPATMLSNASPPLVLIGQHGETMGLGLHQGHTHKGIVAVEFQ